MARGGREEEALPEEEAARGEEVAAREAHARCLWKCQARGGGERGVGWVGRMGGSVACGGGRGEKCGSAGHTASEGACTYRSTPIPILPLTSCLIT